MAASRADGYSELLLQLLGAKSEAGLQQAGLVAESIDTHKLAASLDPLWVAAPVDVLTVRVNGARVDARFGAPDGRGWLAVLWVTEGPSPVVLDATVYERPQAFVGRAGGAVVVLNGPSSVGKSSLMLAFADRADTPWACLEEPWFGKLPTRFLAWPSAAGPVGDGFLEALGASARVGNQFIVSAARIRQEAFRRALRDVPTVYVGLDAPLDVLVRRQLTQPDKFGGLAEESSDIHDGWEYDLRIDMEACSPDEAARQLAAFLADGTRRRAQ
jgi:chloramphenicol 3-O phosphotransferase